MDQQTYFEQRDTFLSRPHYELALIGIGISVFLAILGILNLPFIFSKLARNWERREIAYVEQLEARSRYSLPEAVYQIAEAWRERVIDAPPFYASLEAQGRVREAYVRTGRAIRERAVDLTVREHERLPTPVAVRLAVVPHRMMPALLGPLPDSSAWLSALESVRARAEREFAHLSRPGATLEQLEQARDISAAFAFWPLSTVALRYGEARDTLDRRILRVRVALNRGVQVQSRPDLMDERLRFGEKVAALYRQTHTPVEVRVAGPQADTLVLTISEPITDVVERPYRFHSGLRSSLFDLGFTAVMVQGPNGEFEDVL